MTRIAGRPPRSPKASESKAKAAREKPKPKTAAQASPSKAWSSSAKATRPARPASPAQVATAATKPTLSAEEKEAYARAKQGLEYLQTLWPVPIDPRETRPNMHLAGLPRDLGDELVAALKPISYSIRHVAVALRSYETLENVPRDYKPPTREQYEVAPDLHKRLRALIADGRSWLKPDTVRGLEKVAAGWENRHSHPGLTNTYPTPFHRETPIERLAKRVGVDLSMYPEKDLLAAKAAWDAGERDVVFQQSNGASDNLVYGVPKRFNDEGEFIRQYCRARTGVFGHWQVI